MSLCVNGNSNGTAKLILAVGSGGSGTDIVNNVAASSTVTTGWHHFALTYENTVGYRVWQDGTMVINSTSNTTSISSKLIAISVGSRRLNAANE
eukprot:52121-Eustigmatos_ZCMA.PRE.1